MRLPEPARGGTTIMPRSQDRPTFDPWPTRSVIRVNRPALDDASIGIRWIAFLRVRKKEVLRVKKRSAVNIVNFLLIRARGYIPTGIYKIKELFYIL